MSSTSNHTILITVKQAGLTQVNTAVNGFAKSTQTAAKGTDALGSSWNKANTGAVKFTKSSTTVGKGLVTVDKGAKNTTKSMGTYEKAATKSTKATEKLGGIIGGAGRGLAFGFIGLGSSVSEAAGMYGMYSDASAKVADAQAEVNRLTEYGITSGTAYARATQQAAEAQRGLNFIQRNTILSFTDIATFVLLAANSLQTLRENAAKAGIGLDAASGAANATNAATMQLEKGTIAASQGFDVLDTSGRRVTTSTEQLATKVGDLDVGVRNMGPGLTDTVTHIDAIYDSNGRVVTSFDDLGTRVTDTTRNIGTRGNGLVGGFDALTNSMVLSEKAAAKQQGVFAKIGTAIKSLPGMFANAGKSIFSFFTNFGTHLGKLPGAFSVLTGAVGTFGKALMGVLAHPIVAIIAGISAAVVALATDFGGIRTAVNNAGVAIGNAIPQAKGLLQAIGDTANGILDFIAEAIGMKKANEDIGNSSTVAQQKMQKMHQSFGAFAQVTQIFDGLRKDIAGTITWWESYNKAIESSSKGHKLFGSIVEQSLGGLKEKYPAIAKDVTIFRDTIDSLVVSGKTEAQVEKEIGDILSWLQARIVTVVGGNEDLGASMEDVTEKGEKAGVSAEDLGTTDQQLADIVNLVRFNLTEEGKVLGTTAAATEDTAKTVADFVADMNMLDTATNAQIASMAQYAPLLDNVGTSLDLTGGKVVTLDQVLLAMNATQQAIGVEAKRIWSDMETEILRVGADALPIVQEAINATKDLHPELGDAIQELYDTWMENMTVTEGQIWLVNEATAEQTKEADNATEAIKKQATELGVYNRITDFTKESAKTLVDLEQQHQDAMNKSRSTLQQLAVARGADQKLIEGTDEALRVFIMTTEEEIDVANEKSNQYVILAKAREADAKAAEIEEKAMRLLVSTMTDQYDTTKMTASGMQTLTKTLDDTANATKLATDEVNNKIATLKKEDAMNKAMLQALKDYAKAHGIEIPQAIENDIEKTEEFIQTSEGIGPAIEKAADKAKAAFDDLVGEAGSAMADLIKEDLVEGDVDKVIEKLEEMGSSLDSFAGRQAVIEVMANTVDFEDGMTSLKEILNTTMAESEMIATHGGDGIVAAFSSSIISQLGSAGAPIVDTVNQIWQTIKSSALPGESGYSLIQKFLAALNQPSQVFSAGQQVGQAAPQGIQSGALGLENILDPQLQGLISSITNSKGPLQGASVTMAEGVPEGVTIGVAPLSKILEPPLTTLEDLIISHTNQFNNAGHDLGASVPEGVETGAEGLEKILEPPITTLEDLIKLHEGKFNNAGQGLGQGATEGVETGAEGLGKILEPPITDLESLLEASTKDFNSLGQDMGGDPGVSGGLVEGLSSSEGQIFGQAEKTLREPLVQNMELGVTDTETALQPIEGIFSQAFLDASAAGTGELRKFFVQVRTGMGTLTTQVNFQLGEMVTKFQEWANNSGTSMKTLVDTHLAYIWTKFSEFSTSMNTYLGTLDQKIKVFAGNTGLSFTAIADTHLAKMEQRFVQFFSQQDVAWGTLDQKIMTFVTNTGTNFTTILDTHLQPMWDRFAEFFTAQDVAWGTLDQKILTFVTNAGTNFTTLKDTHLAALWTAFSDFSISVTTYSDSMGQSLATFANSASVSLGEVGAALSLLWGEFSKFSTSVSTYSSSMGTAISNFAGVASKALGGVSAVVIQVGTNFGSAAKAIQSALSSATSTINSFAGTTSKTLGNLSAVILGVGTNFGKMATATKTAMSQAASAAKSAASSISSSMNSIVNAANKAVSALNKVASAAKAAARAKASAGLRFGGSFVNDPVGGSSIFAQHGQSFVNTRPRKIGGRNISEFSKPELVTVTPLSDPNNPMDKGIKMFEGMNAPQSQQTIKPQIQTSTGGLGQGGGSSRPIVVTGNIHMEVRTASGKVLAQEVKPFMLEGFSNIT